MSMSDHKLDCYKDHKHKIPACCASTCWCFRNTTPSTLMERVKLFRIGFKEGAGIRPIQYKNESDYMEGYEAGREAYRKASLEFLQEHKLPEPTVLRAWGNKEHKLCCDEMHLHTPPKCCSPECWCLEPIVWRREAVLATKKRHA